MSRVLGLTLALCVTMLLLASPPVVAADDLFDLVEVENQGRSVVAELADVDGDGRRDLVVVSLSGVPPEDQRQVRVFLQDPGGRFPRRPDHALALPRWSAVYQLVDVREDNPGDEMVLLRPDGVAILGLGSPQAPRWELLVPGPSTVGVADDERGLEPYRLVYDDFGEQPWILVPQLGQLTALSPRGEVLARLAIPRRANYFVLPRTGLLALESDFQVFVDVPKLMLGDIDGDGQTDIASSTRHEIKVFLRRPDGTFPFEPDQELPLRLVTPRDHIRGSGGVTCETGDIDGDGRLDLLVSHVMGGFTDSSTKTYVYLNHDGGWKLGSPDQTITKPASLASNTLADMLGDERLELVRAEFRFGILEVVETLLSRSIDVDVSIIPFDGDDGFASRPAAHKKVTLPISFDTFRPTGFIPSARHDLNGDGYVDFVSSGNGKKIEVYAGGPEGPFERKPLRQSMPTAGVIHFDDWSGDGLPDFVLFDPHNFDVPVRLGRNLGRLPVYD